MVGVAVGAPISWAFIATLIQIWQILGNAGWLPFLALGGKAKEEQDKDGDDEEEESSDGDKEEPTKCSRCHKCLFCGGGVACFLSCVYCFSCGTLMSKKFTWRKDNEDSAEPPAGEDPGLEDIEEDAADVEENPRGAPLQRNPSNGGLQDKNLDEKGNQANEKDIIDTNHIKFTERYLSTMHWLENPYKIPQATGEEYSISSHGWHTRTDDSNTKESNRIQTFSKPQQNVMPSGGLQGQETDVQDRVNSPTTVIVTQPGVSRAQGTESLYNQRGSEASQGSVVSHGSPVLSDGSDR